MIKNELHYICEKIANYNDNDYLVVKAEKCFESKKWRLLIAKCKDCKVVNDAKELSDRLVKYDCAEGFIIDEFSVEHKNRITLFDIICHNVESEEPLESNGDLPTPKDLQNPETCLGCHQNDSSVCDGRCFDKADDPFED